MTPIRGKIGQFLPTSELGRRQKASKKVKEINEKKKKKNRSNSAECCEAITSIGRRIVDVALVSQLMWCVQCDIPLSFRYMKKEIQRGLASIFYVCCHKCDKIVKVPTSASVHFLDGSSLSAVNCKAAAGCLDSGVGHEQINTLLLAMNLPIIHLTTMKRAQAKVGPAFEAMANESCIQAIQEERQLALELQRSNTDNNGEDVDVDSSEEVGITCEYDFGWDKRGNGFAYDSKSGRASVFGHLSRKVLSYQVLSTVCAVCYHGHQPGDHDCRKNHNGSSKYFILDSFSLHICVHVL